MPPLGLTRSVVKRNHAVLTADSHVKAPLPGWSNTPIIMLIAPRLGSQFSQFFALLSGDSLVTAPPHGIERFVYVVEGAIELKLHGATHHLTVGGYAFLPANVAHEIRASSAKLNVYEKRYQPLVHVDPPAPLIGNEQAIAPSNFLGDPQVRVKMLLPDENSFDMAVNIMAFDPGGALPFVEVHVMEHGLLMINGSGIYRLEDDWYPVETGDVIWMGPYCPQWFTAYGKGEARYLLYKDWRRDVL